MRVSITKHFAHSFSSRTSMNALGLVVALLALSVIGLITFRWLRLPALTVYLFIGVLVGSSGLELVANSDEISHLAEFGTVFLLFSIGLEFSLPRLMQMRGLVLGLGGLQFTLTALVIGLAFKFLTDTSWQIAAVIGAMIAMSSTAIVVRLLADRRELETPYGRQAFGVLLFQDLAVVPLLILIPAVAGSADQLGPTLGWALVKAALVLALILLAGQKLMRTWFHFVAARHSNELFIVNVLLITLGAAWLTHWAGLTLALGAFVAGVLISETEYRHQVEEDIRPFRDVFLGLFFLTVGMQLDLSIVVREAGLLVLLVLGQLLIKIVIVGVLSRLFSGDSSVAVRTALALAPGGEFSLVLATVAVSSKLAAPELLQPVVASVLLTMLFGPMLVQHSDRIALRLVRSEWTNRSLALHQLAIRSFGVERHVVLCGYGRTGQAIARFFDQLGVRYVALDLDPVRIREAGAAGESVVFGDASRREILIAAGLQRAAGVVVTFADPAMALKILAHARAARPDVPVIVRTTDDAHLDELKAAGANEVVPDTFESSLMLASHALVMIGVPMRKVLHQLRIIRDERYESLRGFFHGESDDAALLDEADHPRLHAVALDEGAFAIGKTIAELDLERCRAKVATVRRTGQRIGGPQREMQLQVHDVVVLMGDAEAVAAGELCLIQGVR